MTREEAISVLKETLDPNVEKSFEEWKEWDTEKHLPAVNMAIEALQFAKHFDLLKEFQSLQEVVRCKECKHRYESECPMYSNVFYIVDKTQDNGFCYRGERDGEI